MPLVGSDRVVASFLGSTKGKMFINGRQHNHKVCRGYK